MISLARLLPATIAFVAICAAGARASTPDAVVRLAVFRSGKSPLAAGTKAPPITGTKDGVSTSFPVTGPTVVNIWATWCGPCLHELPGFVRASGKYAGRVTFVGLAAESPHGDVVTTTRRLGVTYEVLELADTTPWHTTAFPSTYVLDSAGVVRWSGAGAIDEAALDDHLAPLLAAPATTPLAESDDEVDVGTGFSIRADGVVVTSADAASVPGLVAVASDGSRRAVLGLLAGDDDLAIMKIEGPLAALDLASSVHAGEPATLGLDGSAAPITTVTGDDVVYAPPAAHAAAGSPLLDADGRVVAVHVAGGRGVSVEHLKKLVASTNLDEAPHAVGPNVKRNLVVSAIVFGAFFVLAVLVPMLVGVIRRRRRAGPKWTKSVH